MEKGTHVYNSLTKSKRWIGSRRCLSPTLPGVIACL